MGLSEAPDTGGRNPIVTKFDTFLNPRGEIADGKFLSVSSRGEIGGLSFCSIGLDSSVGRLSL